MWAAQATGKQSVYRTHTHRAWSPDSLDTFVRGPPNPSTLPRLHHSRVEISSGATVRRKSACASHMRTAAATSARRCDGTNGWRRETRRALDENAFTGTMPTELGLLKSIQTLCVMNPPSLAPAYPPPRPSQAHAAAARSCPRFRTRPASAHVTNREAPSLPASH